MAPSTGPRSPLTTLSAVPESCRSPSRSRAPALPLSVSSLPLSFSSPLTSPSLPLEPSLA
eukprot:764142-Hanusia_phi.AAC.1